jgi:hypothetical protein
VTQPATTFSETRPIPLSNVFIVVERTLTLVQAPGGRILIAMWLVVLSLFASWMRVPLADRFGEVSYIALVVLLVRDPRRVGLIALLQRVITAKLKV